MTLHLVLADRALDEWAVHPGSAPFPVNDPVALNAFRQGSFGPDLGYFPGGHRFVSDLAHCVRAADLARSLLALADTPRERAFAWGWVTHVLADQAIHPLVGLAVGELTTGRSGTFVAGDQDTASHVRIETGLDAWYSMRHPGLRLWHPDPVFDGENIRFLVRAYRATYALALDPALVFSSHMAATRMSARALRTVGILSSTLEGRMGRGAAVRLARRGMDRLRMGVDRARGQDSLLMALLTPVVPFGWLLDGVDEVVQGFGRLMLEHVRSDGFHLENRNLDTGRPDGEAAHGLTLATLRLLRARRGLGLEVGGGPVGSGTRGF